MFFYFSAVSWIELWKLWGLLLIIKRKNNLRVGTLNIWQTSCSSTPVKQFLCQYTKTANLRIGCMTSLTLQVFITGVLRCTGVTPRGVPCIREVPLKKNKNNMKWEEGHNMYIIYTIRRRQGIHISRLQQNLDTKRERQAHSCNLNFVSFCSFEWVLKSERIFF